MSVSVYWIHHKDHTDMFSQGYVGVSKNIEARWFRHSRYSDNQHLKSAIKKYGWFMNEDSENPECEKKLLHQKYAEKEMVRSFH